MRALTIVAAAALLSGCGLPPAVAIASYAVDGVLLAATGKTSKDHALSVAMQQDCNFFHVIEGEEICQDYEPTRRAAWALASMPANEAHLVTVSDGRVIRVAANPDALPLQTEGVAIAAASAATPASTPPAPAGER